MWKTSSPFRRNALIPGIAVPGMSSVHVVRRAWLGELGLGAELHQHRVTRSAGGTALCRGVVE